MSIEENTDFFKLINEFLNTIDDDGDNEYYLSKKELYKMVLDDFITYLIGCK